MVSTPTRTEKIDPSTLTLTDRVVHTRRVIKVVAGGRHRRFNALVVVGDGEGIVGIGLGKAEAIPDAVRKASATAQKELMRVPMSGSTVPHEIIGKFRSSLVLIKPAPPGTGVIAAGGVRAIMEMAGVKDVVTKSLGSRNPINVVKATMEGLKQLINPAVAQAIRKGLPLPEEVSEADESANVQ
jgi:small subunit ribosomal protein S5